MLGEYVLRQLNYTSALDPSGQGKEKWSEKGQRRSPSVWHGHESPWSRSPTEIDGLKPSCQVPTREGCPLGKWAPAVG